MFVVTGGAGFIGSAIVHKLNSEGIDDIIIVDELGTSDKWKNFSNKSISDFINKDKFLEQISNNDLPFSIQAIIHMGACSSTTETNADFFMENNYRYSKIIADWAIKNNVRLIYASSGATYGAGSAGYSDDDSFTKQLRPLNIYGFSKQLFDLWAIRTGAVKKIVGIKFFNVFGPNEYHKGDMSSVVFKAYQQINTTGKVRLFKSYNDNYRDGEQKRDFIYIKDCLEVIWWLLNRPETNGIFNLGTGKARTWNDLANAVFDAMEKQKKIEYIEMPDAIRDHYQYFTEAKMDKMNATGCPIKFQSLNDSIHDYVVNYLQQPDPYL